MKKVVTLVALSLTTFLAHAVELTEVELTCDGTKYRLSDFLNEQKQLSVSAKSKPTARGEYETASEYQARLSKARAGFDGIGSCSEASLSVPVRLQYSADEEQFTFLSVDNFNYSHGMRLLVNYERIASPGSYSAIQLANSPSDRRCLETTLKNGARVDGTFLTRLTVFGDGRVTCHLQGDYNKWVGGFAIYAHSPVLRAKQVKTFEPRLRLVASGSLTTSTSPYLEARFSANTISLVNLENQNTLFALGQ